jgi:hypothetical protein
MQEALGSITSTALKKKKKERKEKAPLTVVRNSTEDRRDML